MIWRTGLKLEEWTWRSVIAWPLRPSVMEEHLLVKIAYATASLRAGGRMDKDALVAAGVRSNGIDELITVLSEWADETLKEMDNGANGLEEDSPMCFVPGQLFRPGNS